MAEQLNVTTERVDDLPILFTQSHKMGIPELLDEYFKPHGNWEGISMGWTRAGWMAHILSEGDHPLNQVQPCVDRVGRTHQDDSECACKVPPIAAIGRSSRRDCSNLATVRIMDPTRRNPK